MNKLTISIAMCTYNGEKYLKEQLDSILIQTILPDELVICDDCSTDSTAQIISDFILTAPFLVRFYKNNFNIGFKSNFEQAINLCNCNIIYLADHDDIWIQNKLEIIQNVFLKNSLIDMVFTNGFLIDEDGITTGGTLWRSFGFNPKPNIDLVAILLKNTVVTGATMALRTRAKSFLLPIPQHIFHDEWIALLLSGVNKFYILNECLIKYRIHHSQITGVTGKSFLFKLNRNKVSLDKMFEDKISAYNEILSGAERYGCLSEIFKCKIKVKILHLQRRRKIISSKYKYKALALIELFNFNYQRYSSGGFLSFLRDLFVF